MNCGIAALALGSATIPRVRKDIRPNGGLGEGGLGENMISLSRRGRGKWNVMACRFSIW